MPILESDIERPACKKIKNRLGVLSIKLNPLGNTGLPDRMFLLPQGKAVFIEFKRPGGRVRSKQKYWIKILRKLGFTALICDGENEAFEAIKKELVTP